MPSISYEYAQAHSIPGYRPAVDIIELPKPELAWGDWIIDTIDNSKIGSAALWLSERMASAIDPTDDQDEPGFDPFAGLAGTHYSAYASSFIGVRNRAQAQRVRDRIDRELARRERLSNANWLQWTLGQGIDFMLDPTSYVPGVKLAGGVGKVAIAVGLAEGGLTGLIGGVAGEAVLQATQETRTWQESMLAIGTNVIFGAAKEGLVSGLREYSPRLAPYIPDRRRPTYFRDMGFSIPKGHFDVGAAQLFGQADVGPAFGMDQSAPQLLPESLVVAAPTIADMPYGDVRAGAISMPRPVELLGEEVSAARRLAQIGASVARAINGLDQAYVTHRMSSQVPDVTPRLTRDAFAEAVGSTLIRGAVHADATVQRAVQALRTELAEPLRFLSAAADTAGGSVLHLYDRERIAERRGVFEQRLADWLDDRGRHALRNGEQSELIGLTAADRQSIAGEITDRILSAPRDVTGAEPVRLQRGPVSQVDMAIPTPRVEEFLDTNAERIGAAVRRVATYGREATQLFRPLDTGASDAAAGAPSLRRTRGGQAMPARPEAITARAVLPTGAINRLRALGDLAIASTPDLIRPGLVHAVRELHGEALPALVRDLRNVTISAGERGMVATALELTLDSRASQIADLLDETLSSRRAGAAQSPFGLHDLMEPWTRFWRKFSGTIAQTRVSAAIMDWAAETVAAEDLTRLQRSGIDRSMALRMSVEIERHGEVLGELRWAKTDDWSDREAADRFQRAIATEADGVIPKRGAALPQWLSPPVIQGVARIHRFMVTTMQRLAGGELDSRNAAALGGFAGLTALGMASYWLEKTSAEVPEPSETPHISGDPIQWAMQGMVRGAAFGYLMTLGHASDMIADGTAVALRPVSATSTLGPIISIADDLALLSEAGSAGLLSDSERRTAVEMVPIQNIFWLRWLLQEVATGVSDAP